MKCKYKVTKFVFTSEFTLIHYLDYADTVVGITTLPCGLVSQMREPKPKYIYLKRHRYNSHVENNDAYWEYLIDTFKPCR